MKHRRRPSERGSGGEATSASLADHFRRRRPPGPGGRALCWPGRAPEPHRDAAAGGAPGSWWWPTRRAASARPRRRSTSPRAGPAWVSGSSSIDLDPQGNASTALGVEHHRGVPSTYDVLVDGGPLDEVVASAPRTSTDLFVVPATIDLAGAEIELVSVVARESDCARRCAPPGSAPRVPATTASTTSSSTARRRWACSPLNALVAGEEVLIPIQASTTRWRGSASCSRPSTWSGRTLNPGLHVSTILITMYDDARTRLAAGSPTRCASTSPTRCSRPRSRARCGLRGAVVRPDRDDLRPGLAGSAVLPRGRARAGPAGQVARAWGPRREPDAHRRGLGRAWAR